MGCRRALPRKEIKGEGCGDDRWTRPRLRAVGGPRRSVLTRIGRGWLGESETGLGGEIDRRDPTLVGPLTELGCGRW